MRSVALTFFGIARGAVFWVLVALALLFVVGAVLANFGPVRVGPARPPGGGLVVTTH